MASSTCTAGDSAYWNAEVTGLENGQGPYLGGKAHRRGWKVDALHWGTSPPFIPQTHPQNALALAPAHCAILPARHENPPDSSPHASWAVPRFPASLFADEYEARTFFRRRWRANWAIGLLQPKNLRTRRKNIRWSSSSTVAGERGTDNAAQLKYGAPLFLKPRKCGDKYPCFRRGTAVSARRDVVRGEGLDRSETRLKRSRPRPMQLLLGGARRGAEGNSPSTRIGLYVNRPSPWAVTATWDLLTRQPQRWAAAAPICGGGDVAADRAPQMGWPSGAFPTAYSIRPCL